MGWDRILALSADNAAAILRVVMRSKMRLVTGCSTGAARAGLVCKPIGLKMSEEQVSYANALIIWFTFTKTEKLTSE